MAEEKKQRRIRGDAYWKLNRYLKKVQKLQEEMAAWQQEQAETLGVYIDLINWRSGAIFEDTAEVKNGIVRNGKVVGRAGKEILEEYSERNKKMMELQDEVTAYRDKLARTLKIWPDQIDWKTGKIDTEAFDGIDLPEDPAEEE